MSANSDMTASPPRPRPTARLIVLDDEDRVLLFQFEDPNVSDPRDPRGAARSPVFWATPGGGVEPGETYEAAALRELQEETGLAVEALGPCLHERENLLVLGQETWLFQQRFYMVRVASGNISLDGLNALEQAVYRAHRWWALAELRTTAEQIFPEDLVEIVGRALAIAPVAVRCREREGA